VKQAALHPDRPVAVWIARGPRFDVAIQGDQLFDVICVGIRLAAEAGLQHDPDLKP